MDKLYIPGDLVYIHGSLRIINNCDGYYATYYDEDETLQEINVNVIEDIPLTPEILKKNGWMLFRMYHWFIEKECLKLRLLELDNHSWYVYIGDNLIRRNMHSVSDLQHILFGIGINHEMEV